MTHNSSRGRNHSCLQEETTLLPISVRGKDDSSLRAGRIPLDDLSGSQFLGTIPACREKPSIPSLTVAAFWNHPCVQGEAMTMNPVALTAGEPSLRAGRSLKKNQLFRPHEEPSLRAGIR